MRKLSIFNQVSLDHFIADGAGDMSWAHKNDPEWNAWVASNASGGGELLFGRVTYQQMENFWQTPAAHEMMPVVAERMNQLPKVVFSRSLRNAKWQNTRLIQSELGPAVQALKNEAGPDLVLMGSASVVAQLAALDLIDTYQVVINSLILGAGKSMFSGLTQPLELKLASSHVFQNGNVALTYERPR